MNGPLHCVKLFKPLPVSGNEMPVCGSLCQRGLVIVASVKFQNTVIRENFHLVTFLANEQHSVFVQEANVLEEFYSF